MKTSVEKALPALARYTDRAMPYQAKIKELSERIVEAQKPIRILDAIKWDAHVKDEFFRNHAKELPKISPEYYEKNRLGFDPRAKDDELAAIANDIKLQLGDKDDIGRVLKSMVSQYREVISMLEGRGTKAFYDSSRVLYGSPKDALFDGHTLIRDQGLAMHRILTQFEDKFLGEDYPKELSSEEVVEELRRRFANSFLKGKVEVVISDGIMADAAAGGDVIKIKHGARFSRKDIDIFEVHEGWVHVATTLNGKAQRVAKFLSKGPPHVAATQEGLAILMEVLTFSTYPHRARTINDRILGIDKAEDGADFLELYQFYLSQGYTASDSYQNSMRVFRGGDVRGKSPFTKDISYCRGFIENYNFIRAAIRKGHPEIVPFLFAGKAHIDDIPLLYQRCREGIVDPPELLPPQFEDLNGLAVWMSFSNFLNTVDMNTVSTYYEGLFKKYL